MHRRKRVDEKSCVTPASTSNELDVQNKWEENTHTHTQNVFVWCPCMAINVSVQHNGEFLPGIILLTQCYDHRGLIVKRFCICSL